MFCIAAFIILSILGIFSVRYRRLAVDAWKCVARRVTLRKCDTTFKEDLKSQLLAKTAAKHPHRARWLERWIDVLAFVFVIIFVWSLFVALRAGLNLYVYNTCNPANSESCSLGSQACSIESNQPPAFWQSLKSGKILTWGRSQANQFGEAISQIPNRIKTWNPRDYISDKNSYYRPYDASKPTALEVLDPSCKFCAQLFRTLKSGDIEDRYNLTYLVFPIPLPSGSYKFPHSYKIASYLEAIKLNPLKSASVPVDWQVLNRLFTESSSPGGITYQAEINTLNYSEAQIDQLLQGWLKDFGYDQTTLNKIVADSQSKAVKESIARQHDIVVKQIKTVKIPTLIINGRRFDGVVSLDQLNNNKPVAPLQKPIPGL